VSNDDDFVAHDYRHDADRWVPWQRGRSAGRRIARMMRRIARDQRDRELRDDGYRDLGGEC
jgi:hypothetical protein